MKIAILGSAPSFSKAPFQDESWEIWAPNFDNLPRITRWFQFHPDQDLEVYPGLIERMRAMTIPVYMQERRPDVPASVRYPIEDMTRKYGSWFFTSSIAYMLALAIEEGPAEIGLWGVTMNHRTEYAAQKPGAHFFLQVARMAGIKVTAPPESEILLDGRLYLFGRNDGLYAKVMAKKEELAGRMAGLHNQRDQMVMRKLMLHGARDVRVLPEEIEKQLGEIAAGLDQTDRDLLTVGGAVQQIEDIEDNWL